MSIGLFEVCFLCRIGPTFVGGCPFYRGDSVEFSVDFLVKRDNQSQCDFNNLSVSYLDRVVSRNKFEV